MEWPYLLEKKKYLDTSAAESNITLTPEILIVIIIKPNKNWSKKEAYDYFNEIISKKSNTINLGIYSMENICSKEVDTNNK